ncbi:DUF3068 domain-containing protein [Angustibacter peucedani]
MRRVLGFVIATIGVAVLVIGALARPVLYDRLATVKLDQKSTSVSEGSGMSALRASADGVEVLRDVQLRSTRQVRGIPGKVNGKDGQAFWQTGVTSEAVGIGQLSFSQEGVSFNRKTAEASNCCGDFVSTGDLDNPSATEPVTHEGLFFKFPFDVQKKTYKFWDGDLDRAEPINYVSTEKLDGVTVYKFEQKLGPEPVGEPRTALPGSLFGTDQPVDAQLVYENIRTLWIEPNTGVIIKGQEQQNKRLEAAGLPAAPVTVGTIGYSDATVKKNAEDWGTKGSLLKALRTTVPVGGIVIGLVLLLLGLFLILGGRRRDGDDGAAHRGQPVAAGV